MAPEKRGRKQQDGDLTLLGSWFKALCDYLEIDETEIARRAGIPKSTISKGTRKKASGGTFNLSREKVLLLRDQIKRALEEKGEDVDLDWETYLLNGAFYATEDQIQEARMALEHFLKMNRSSEK